MMEVLDIMSRLLASILITARRCRGGHVATVVHKRGCIVALNSEWP